MRNSGFQTTSKFNKEQIKPGYRLVVPKKISPDDKQKPYLTEIPVKVRVKNGKIRVKVHPQPPNSFLQNVMSPKDANVMRNASLSSGWKNNRKPTRGRMVKYIPQWLAEAVVMKWGKVGKNLVRYEKTIKVPSKPMKKLNIIKYKQEK